MKTISPKSLLVVESRSFIYRGVSFNLNLLHSGVIIAKAESRLSGGRARVLESWASGSIKAFRFCDPNRSHGRNPFGSHVAAQSVFYAEFKDMNKLPY